MRAGWQSKTIGEVCEVVNGGTPKTSIAHYWGGDHLWITPAEMGKRSSPYVSETERKLTDLGLGDSSARLLPPLSIILSSRAPIGHLVINTAAMATNQGCKGLVPSKFVDHKFLFYYLGNIVGLLNDLGTGTTFKELSGGKLKEVPLPVPPLPEQKRIVAILDEVFEGIDVAVANAEKNVANARELFDGYLRSAFSQRGLGWEEKTLKEVAAEFGRGKSKHRPRGDVKLLGGQYPLIQTGDVANSNHRIVGYSQTYNEFGLAQSKLWPTGTVCIAIVGANVAETAILDFDACFPDSVIGLVVDDRLADNEYVEFLLQTFKEILKQRGKGTARDNINMATFENQTFPFPDVAEQRRIVALINDLAEQTQRLEALHQQKLAILAELKQSILQRAFAGELTAQPEQLLQEAVA